MSGFTPGPWEVKRAAKPDNTGGYDWAVIAPGKAIIAEFFEHVDWRDPGVTYDIRPAEAHARLFLAAPDLLDALELARTFMVDFEGLPESHVGDNPLTVIDSAIAKAKGSVAPSRGWGL